MCVSLQLAAIALNFCVLVSAVYEGIYARRGGDPTRIRVVADPRAATINNPGYREHHQPTNGKKSRQTSEAFRSFADSPTGNSPSVPICARSDRPNFTRPPKFTGRVFPT